MSLYGLNTQIVLDRSLVGLPGLTFKKVCEKLDTNPRDSDWRALIRVVEVEERYRISQVQIEKWSLAASNGRESASRLALTELSSRGMRVAELVEYLDKLNIDTYPLGLSRYECVTILEQPEEFLEVCEGGQIVLEVRARGHPFPRYQWFFCKNGSNDFQDLSGRTESILRLNKVTNENAGTYACQIHNCDKPEETKITSNTLVSVLAVPAAQEFSQEFSGETLQKNIDNDDTENILHYLKNLGPLEPVEAHDDKLLDSYRKRSTVARHLITKHPMDVTVGVNEEILVAVETDGDPPISYEWYKDDQPVGVLVPKLRIPNARPQDFGNYYCVVKNGLVKERSNMAHVKERFPTHDQLATSSADIVLVAQPKSASVKFGGSVMFSCEARCCLPLQYQWFKDGSPLLGETLSEIKMINIQDRRSEGTYQCEVRVDRPGIPRRLTSVAFLKVEVPQYIENIEYNPSDKVALLIGNYDYRNEESLKAPSSDVHVLSEIFRSLQFKVVSLLNLTKPEIENAVKEFCHLVERNVYSVFYFCGHGFEENGISYLVPTDAPAGYRADECVRADLVLEDIQKKEPPLILMIMDICRRLNKVMGTSVPVHLPKTPRGNTVFCYATSTDLNAYEDKRRGLLVQHLEPILRRRVGIEALISELKEEFGRHAKHSKIQIPELRSNLSEPRRSLTDAISIKGQTQAYKRRQLIWQQAHMKPEKQHFCFRDVGVKVELDFQSDFSNVLHIFAAVTDRGVTAQCRADIMNVPLTVSSVGPKECISGGNYITTTTIQDIQKLQTNLVIDLVITFVLKGENQQRHHKTIMDLGMPLVSMLKLWRQPPSNLLANRQPTEQGDETDSSYSFQ